MTINFLAARTKNKAAILFYFQWQMQYFEIDIAVKCVLIALIEKYALYFHNPRSMNVCGL